MTVVELMSISTLLNILIGPKAKDILIDWLELFVCDETKMYDRSIDKEVADW